VCCHKADSYIRNDGIYEPIQVGKELSQVDLGFLKDNTGDNISGKNHEYCELTALYWMWKNTSADFVGLCHYRRYFSDKVTPQFVRDTLCGGKYDVIVCKAAVHPYKNFYEINLYIGIENFLLLADSLVKLHPECYEAMSRTTWFSNRWTPCNMFIASRKWTGEYCQWLFPILEDVEKRMAKSPYTRANRALGYMGEYLLGVYLSYSKARVRRVDMQPIMEYGGKTRKYTQQMPFRTMALNNLAFGISMAEVYLKRLVARMLGMGGSHPMPLLPAGITGFKADGIDISPLVEATENMKRPRQEKKAELLKRLSFMNRILKPK